MYLSDYVFGKVIRSKIADSNCMHIWVAEWYIYIKTILQEYFINLPSYHQGDNVHGHYHSFVFAKLGRRQMISH